MTLIKVPEHVSVPQEAMPFWNSLVQTRAKERWTLPDLEIAAHLAKSKADLERIHKEVAEEGDLVINARGTQIPNPKHTILETISRRIVQLSRLLQVHAEATQGKSRDQVKANKAQAKAKDSLDSLDELIARPN